MGTNRTREEQLQEWRERRGIKWNTLRQKPGNEAVSTSLPNPPTISSLSAQQDSQSAIPAKRKAPDTGGDEGKENQHSMGDPIHAIAISNKVQRQRSPGKDVPDQNHAKHSADVKPEPRVPNFMAPTKSFKSYTARPEPSGDGAGAPPVHAGSFSAKAPRDSLAALGLTENAGGAGNLLRERMSILRRDSAAPGGGADAPPRWSVVDSEIGAPGETKIPSLDALAAQLFAQDLHQQCEKALTCQLKSTREGATKDTRIQELADLTKLTRRLLKHVLTNSKQFVNVAVTAQRQLEQEIEGLRLQQMSATSAHEALKAEMARAQAELAQAQNARMRETVGMKLELEKQESEVKRLGRALHEVEEERDAMRSASEAAKEAADAAMQVKNDLEAALEAANRQRDQSLNAAAAARDVEMAATSRAREVEMAAADALKRADKAEAQAAIATASTKAAELRAETARRSLQAKQLELETLQAQHEEVLESSQAVLKDYEELQSRCNNVLADLTIKTASLQAVTSQLVTEEGKCQELTVKVSSLRAEANHLHQEGAKLQAEADVRSSTIDRMAKQLAEQMDRCGSAEAQVAKLQAEQKSASARESALASEKSKLADDLVRACKAHEAMKDEMDKALNALQVENSELLGRIEELARAEEGARDVIEKLGAEVQAKSEAADALQGRLIAEQAAMVEVKVLAEDKAQRLARLESEMDALREVAGIAADGGKEGDMVSALLARVSALDAAAMEAHKERRALHNALVDLRGNIRVFCRVRPLDPSQPTSVSLGSDGNSVRVVTSRGGGKPALFSFDKVFGGSATQASVYGEVSELVQSALDGYNVCLFSYGQTGAGKTHTMQGSQTPEGRGIIPRAVAQLLAAVKKLQAQGWEYSLEASYVEIYNEAIRDLLSPGSSQAPAAGLAIQHLSSGTALLGAERVLVTSVEEAEALVSRAGRARAVEATAMNATSSRSHSIFMLYCTGANSEAGVRLSGALNLVDLAGSERLNRSKAEGARQKEACAINKSLSALGDVFASLASKAQHIPYRNSKLTHLLQPCLGGDGKTLMFVNINPEEASADETLCSLKFASQVSQCETSAKGGAKRHVTSLLAQETTIAESLPGVALVQHQAMGQSQRHETLSKSSRRDSLALNNRSKPQLKRKA